MNTNPQPDPIAAAGRRHRREARFGPDATCIRCGMREPETLVPMRRRFLEAHHVCGRANDESLTAPVCRNCHAVLTERQRAAGVSFAPPPTLLHQIVAALTSVFIMGLDLCEHGLAWMRALSALITELDAAHPDWRSLPSAKVIGFSS